MYRFLIIILMIYPLQGYSFWGKPQLKDLVGEYRLSESESDHFCQKIDDLFITVDRHDVTIELVKDGDLIKSEYFEGVNTSHYEEYSNLTAIIYSRYRYQNKQLKRQESVWALGIIPARYKDERIVVDVISDNEIIYNYREFGRTFCKFTRVDY